MNEANGAVGFDEVDKAPAAVAINVAAFLGILTIICIRALPIVHQRKWATVFAFVLNIDCWSVHSCMLYSLEPHDGWFEHWTKLGTG